MKKTFKILFVILITLLIITISTWIFLKNTLKGKFITASEKFDQGIITMVSPRSGEIIMEKYIIRSGEIINKFKNIPVFPLLTGKEKNKMKIKVLSGIKLLKRKYEKWEGADFAKTRQSYSRIINKFQESFPDILITDTKLIKFKETKTAVERKKPNIKSPDISVKSVKKEDKPEFINKKENTKTDKKKEPEKPKSEKIVKEDKKDDNESISIIPISEANKYLDEKVIVYLKSGRKLKGLIKAVKKRFIFLDINFKGGTFTAKFKFRDIDKIVRIIERSFFDLIEE